MISALLQLESLIKLYHWLLLRIDSLDISDR